MFGQNTERQATPLRHLSLNFNGHVRSGVVCWFGAVIPNTRVRTLPLVMVWLRELRIDGSLGEYFCITVGITELSLLQIGTIWHKRECHSQFVLEERQVSVDYSQQNWRFTSCQTHDVRSGELIPRNLYPLKFGARDCSELIVFSVGHNMELLVPSLEFFSRCYGRSAETNRVLCTYPWSEAQDRLYLPDSEETAQGSWRVKLPANIYNDDAVFIAHVKYESEAQTVARRIYADLEASFGDINRRNKWAFPKIGPWFSGPATLIVQGVPLDENRFLALRIVGSSDPLGPPIYCTRENRVDAGESALDGAQERPWVRAGAFRPLPFVTLTSTNPAGHGGGSVEVLSPSFRVVGRRRMVIHQRHPGAGASRGVPLPNAASERYSAGEQEGTDGSTGLASIHAEIQLESSGAVRDVWNALLHLHETMPKLITDVSWYNQREGVIVSSDDGGPCLASLPLPAFDDVSEDDRKVGAWVFADSARTRIRGVLIAVVQTPERTAYLFEVERRFVEHAEGDGNKESTEEAYSGLIVSPPPDVDPSDWIPRVLASIRDKKGIMKHVLGSCPGTSKDFYKRSFSKDDLFAGHSTVINALGKVGIWVNRP